MAEQTQAVVAMHRNGGSTGDVGGAQQLARGGGASRVAALGRGLDAHRRWEDIRSMTMMTLMAAWQQSGNDSDRQ
ncbi:hypothetical protein E2562_026063 [Oryza meyeriana var. granulata]|uniref:Uncharacterized protein n=1 Tax=Oryza meyeriana var. granulata TaxID=110450 RepID=A0A6G1E2W3_9ORYZ|nr:hypothetical protein E2562_026063 [Oryza meyeriana var. granulata]